MDLSPEEKQEIQRAVRSLPRDNLTRQRLEHDGYLAALAPTEQPLPLRPRLLPKAEVLTTTEAAVLAALRDEPQTRGQVTQTTGLAASSVRYALSQLTAGGRCSARGVGTKSDPFLYSRTR